MIIRLKPFSCRWCHKSFSTEKGELDHRLQVHENDSREYGPRFCNEGKHEFKYATYYNKKKFGSCRHCKATCEIDIE